MFLKRLLQPTWHKYGLTSSTFGSRGVKLHWPCVVWYLSPFACLYDLLQPAFGQRKGFGAGTDADESEERGLVGDGVPTSDDSSGVVPRDAAGVFSGEGVAEGLNKSAGGTQADNAPLPIVGVSGRSG